MLQNDSAAATCMFSLVCFTLRNTSINYSSELQWRAAGHAAGQLPSEYQQALLCVYAHARTAVRSDVI